MTAIMDHHPGTSSDGEERKRTLVRIACVLGIAVALAATVIAVSSPDTDADPTVVDRGTCGQDITYTLYSDGLFTVVYTGSGDGAWMDNYNDFLKPPWYYDRDKIKTVSIGDKVGDFTFCDCRNLTSLTLPDSVVHIGYEAFAVCGGLKGPLIISDSVDFIGDSAFLRTGYSSLTLGDSVKSIGRDTFFDCRGFKGPLIISDSVKSIGWGSFRNCDGFSSLTLGNLVTSSGMASIFKSSKFVSISLPGVNYAGTPSQSMPNSTFHENGALIASPTWDDLKGKAWYGSGNRNYYTGNLTVTLDPNDGSQATTKTVAYGQTYGDLPQPTSGGKTFAGWFTEQSGGSQVKADTKVMFVDTQTLYAHWN